MHIVRCTYNLLYCFHGLDLFTFFPYDHLYFSLLISQESWLLGRKYKETDQRPLKLKWSSFTTIYCTGIRDTWNINGRHFVMHVVLYTRRTPSFLNVENCLFSSFSVIAFTVRTINSTVACAFLNHLSSKRNFFFFIIKSSFAANDTYQKIK